MPWAHGEDKPPAGMQTDSSVQLRLRYCGLTSPRVPRVQKTPNPSQAGETTPRILHEGRRGRKLCMWD